MSQRTGTTLQRFDTFDIKISTLDSHTWSNQPGGQAYLVEVLPTPLHDAGIHKHLALGNLATRLERMAEVVRREAAEEAKRHDATLYPFST
jgi:hypothetical protein